MRIVRFLKAIVKYIRFGQRTSIDEYINRLTICKGCIYFDNEKWACKKFTHAHFKVQFILFSQKVQNLLYHI